MLIYKLTHVPTGKIYIGSLKDSKRWGSYNTSSRVVKLMLEENSNEWIREITHDEFPDEWTYKEVVDLENELIKEAVLTIGWESVWNKHYGANAYSPEAMAAAKAAQETPEWKEKRSANSKKWFVENPEKAEVRRIKITQTMSENIPKLRAVQLEYIKNNPEAHRARQEAANLAKQSPEAREKNSKAKEDWYRNNPEKAKELHEKITITKQTAESKLRMSHGQKERFKNPDELKKLKKIAKDRFESPLERSMASDRTKAYFNQDGVKEAHTKKQIERFGKTIEVTFEDGTTYKCVGRKALETKLGCAGILRVIKGLRQYATCKESEFAGKKLFQLDTWMNEYEKTFINYACTQSRQAQSTVL